MAFSNGEPVEMRRRDMEPRGKMGVSAARGRTARPRLWLHYGWRAVTPDDAGAGELQRLAKMSRTMRAASRIRSTVVTMLCARQREATARLVEDAAAITRPAARVASGGRVRAGPPPPS